MFVNYDGGDPDPTSVIQDILIPETGRAEIQEYTSDQSIDWMKMLSLADQDDAYYLLVDQGDDTTSLCDAISSADGAYSIWLQGSRSYMDSYGSGFLRTQWAAGKDARNPYPL